MAACRAAEWAGWICKRADAHPGQVMTGLGRDDGSCWELDVVGGKERDRPALAGAATSFAFRLIICLSIFAATQRRQSGGGAPNRRKSNGEMSWRRVRPARRSAMSSAVTGASVSPMC
jgi:hypothetical protein